MSLSYTSNYNTYTRFVNKKGKGAKERVHCAGFRVQKSPSLAKGVPSGTRRGSGIVILAKARMGLNGVGQMYRHLQQVKIQMVFSPHFCLHRNDKNARGRIIKKHAGKTRVFMIDNVACVLLKCTTGSNNFSPLFVSYKWRKTGGKGNKMNRNKNRYLSFIFACFLGMFALVGNAFAAACNTYNTEYYNFTNPDSNEVECIAWNCPATGAEKAARHISSCGGGNGSYDYICASGYTRQAVKRYEGSAWHWQYECRCSSKKYEYYGDASIPSAHSADNWNFTCKSCGSKGTNYPLLTCGWGGSTVGFADYVCNTGFTVTDTGSGLSCACGTDMYIYTEASGVKACIHCPYLPYNSGQFTGISTCGNGTFTCSNGYIRSRQDGTDHYDYGYACANCAANSRTYARIVNPYTGVRDTSSSGATLGTLAEYGYANFGSNCAITVPWTDVTDNEPDPSSGAACDVTQTYKRTCLTADANYSTNFNATCNYTVTSNSFTKVAPGSAISGTATAGDSRCVKCSGDTFSAGATSSSLVQYVTNGCKPVPIYGTVNSAHSDFTCNEHYYKYYSYGNGMYGTCYPCPAISSGMPNFGYSQQTYGMELGVAPAGATSATQCYARIYDGDTYGTFYKNGCTYSAGSGGPGGSSDARVITCYIPTSCKNDMAGCIFYDAWDMGAFPWATNEGAIQVMSGFNYASEQNYVFDEWAGARAMACIDMGVCSSASCSMTAQ